MKIPRNSQFFWFILLELVAEPGCRRTEPPGQQARLSPSRTGTLAAASAAPAEAAALVRRLCSALHRLPAERKSACCGHSVEAPLFDECERVTLAALNSGAISLDPLALADCEQAMQGALSGCLWISPANPQGPEICQRALVARRGAGQTCRSSLECRAPLHCAIGGPIGGTCRPPAELGAGCGVATDALGAYTVSRGLELEHPPCRDFCALSSHKCEPLPALGSACRASVNCGPGRRCSAGQCVARTSAEERVLLARPGGMQCTVVLDGRVLATAPKSALPLLDVTR